MADCCSNCGCTEAGVHLRICKSCGAEYCDRCVGYECQECHICEDKISIFANWRAAGERITGAAKDRARCHTCHNQGEMNKCRRCGYITCDGCTTEPCPGCGRVSSFFQHIHQRL